MEYNIIKLHKRRFERLHKAIPVRFKIADKLSTDKQKECTAIANNISEGGFSVEVTELEKGLFNIGSRQYVMNASINLPGYSNEIKTVVKPVWDKKSSFTKKHMIGLKFIEMVDINKRCLSSYIANELKMQELYSIPKGRRIKEIGIAKQTPLLSGFLELVKAVILVGLPSLIKMKKAKKLADEMQKGFFATKAISALLNIGFFDEFSANKSVNLSMFAKKKNVDRRLLRLLCDYLCSIKIFKNHASEYSLTSKGLLVKEVMKGVFDITYAFDDIIHNIEPLLKKEKIIYKDVNRRLDFEAKGSSALAEFLPYPIVKDIIIKRGFENILDIGCGIGTFLIKLCQADSKINGYGVDLSYKTLIYAQEQFKKYNLEKRISLFEGDITKDIDELAGRLNKVDVITAFFLLHELFFEQKEELIGFLSKLRHNFKNRPIIICENIRLELEELKKDPGLYSELQLMHGFSCEQQLSRKEWKDVFGKAGFSVLEERYLSFAKIVIYILI